MPISENVNIEVTPKTSFAAARGNAVIQSGTDNRVYIFSSQKQLM